MTVDILLMQDFQDRKNHKSLWLFSRILTASNFFSPNRKGSLVPIFCNTRVCCMKIDDDGAVHVIEAIHMKMKMHSGKIANFSYHENKNVWRRKVYFLINGGLSSKAEAQHVPGFFKHYVWLKFKAFLHTATRMYDSRALTSSKPSITLFFAIIQPKIMRVLLIVYFLPKL